jgi:hypothetical protein
VPGPYARHPGRRVAWVVFACVLGAQLAISARAPDDWHLQASAGEAPSRSAVELAFLGEGALAAYATSLYIQSFDAQAGAILPLRTSDFPAVRSWLALSFALNPDSGYPLMLAAFDYAETAHLQDDTEKPAVAQAPQVLEFVEQGYRQDPHKHWRWLAHAAWVARYVLHDDARAGIEARLLRDAPESAQVPRWARELDGYVLSRPDPVEARRALLGGLIAGKSGAGDREIGRLAGRIEAQANRKNPESAGDPQTYHGMPGVNPAP